MSVSVSPSTNSTTTILANSSYVQLFTAYGAGTDVGYDWSVYSGTLPPGTSLDTVDSTVSGTLNTAGTFSYQIKATDGATGAFGVSGTLTVVVDTSGISISPSGDASASGYIYVNNSYSQQNIASFGYLPYTYSVSSGTIPPGTSLDPSSGLVSGTPTTVGIYSYYIQATDNSDHTATTGTITATISGMTIDPSDNIDTSGCANTLYSQQNTASYGYTPYTYSVSSGTIPTDTSLDPSSGLVSGYPDASGIYSYQIQATDTSGHTATTGTITATISSLPLVISPSGNIDTSGIVNYIYSQQNTASYGVGTYTYSVVDTSGQIIPPGTTLDTSSGLVSGTPTTAGIYSYQIQATDSVGDIATTGTITVTISSLPLVISPSGNIDTSGYVNDIYSQQNTASYGVGTYTYSVGTGSLPTGTTLDTSSGLVYGTPTTAGIYSYQIQATDSVGDIATTGTITATISDMVISPSGNINTTGIVNNLYSQQNTASQGYTPYTYSIGTGSLPTGTTLDTSSGLVSGTPTKSGTYSYQIQATDSTGATAITGTITATISSLPLAIDPSGNINTTGYVNSFYIQKNTATGGITPYTYSVSSGSLPTDTSLNTVIGSVYGYPNESGTYSYQIQATDSSGETAVTGTITATIGILPLAIDPSGNINTSGVVNDQYIQKNTAKYGYLPYTYSVSSGTIPKSTILDTSSGSVSGFATTAGTCSYQIQATDSTGATATTGTITVTISSSVSTDPSGNYDQSGEADPSGNTYSNFSGSYKQNNSRGIYKQQTTATGGTPPYTFLLISGTLPNICTLNSSTGLVNGTPTKTGKFKYKVRATDSKGLYDDTGTITATIYPHVSITPNTTTSTGNIGVPYTQTNTANDGVASYIYSLYSGTLPPGTNLNTSTGVVSGIPTKTVSTLNILNVKKGIVSKTSSKNTQYTYQIGVTDSLGATANTDVITATITDDTPCFNHDTKILCLNNNLEEEYIPIQDLRKGNLVKTYLHGYRKISCIGKGQMKNNPDDWQKCMYKMKKTKTNGLIEDLIVTGGHSILVDELTHEEQEEQKKIKFNLKIDDKHLLLLGLSKSNKFIQMKDSKIYTYYHLVPENNGDDNQRFGIWANGVLSETPSKYTFMEHNFEDI